MQTLIFNTHTKKVELYAGVANQTELLYEFDNVPTVKVMDGFYEVMQEESSIKYPVLRVPIVNTNMSIVH